MFIKNLNLPPLPCALKSTLPNALFKSSAPAIILSNPDFASRKGPASLELMNLSPKLPIPNPAEDGSASPSYIGPKSATDI